MQNSVIVSVNPSTILILCHDVVILLGYTLINRITFGKTGTTDGYHPKTSHFDSCYWRSPFQPPGYFTVLISLCFKQFRPKSANGRNLPLYLPCIRPDCLWTTNFLYFASCRSYDWRW